MDSLTRLNPRQRFHIFVPGEKILIEKYGDSIRTSIEAVIPESLCIKPGECAVYSLGEKINENQAYCKSLLDEESGMIDFNSLDNVSIQMGEEFEALENAYIEMIREE